MNKQIQKAIYAMLAWIFAMDSIAGIYILTNIKAAQNILIGLLLFGMYVCGAIGCGACLNLARRVDVVVK